MVAFIFYCLTEVSHLIFFCRSWNTGRYRLHARPSDEQSEVALSHQPGCSVVPTTHTRGNCRHFAYL